MNGLLPACPQGTNAAVGMESMQQALQWELLSVLKPHAR